jgi:ATP-dependent Clp protease ATP-binding subunit ClpC
MPGLPARDLQGGPTGGKRGDGISEYTRRILEGSLREAIKHGDGRVGVEHLLLALLSDSRNGAVQTLESLHATPTKIRTELEREWRAISASADAE